MTEETEATKKNDENREPGELVEIAAELLDLLVCPLTKEPLTYNRETNELISKSAKLAYPIHNGIPVMLPSEAREISKTQT